MKKFLPSWRMILPMIIFLLSLSSPTSAYTQGEYEVTLIKSNISIADVFKAIKSQTGLTVFYTNRLLNDREKVNAAFKKANLANVLSSTLKDKNIGWVLREQFIVLQKKGTELKKEARVVSGIPQTNLVETIKGHVTDEKGQSLPGVSVKLKGTTTGTVTDVNGNYTLNFPQASGVLVFSFLGFKTQEITINGQSKIDIRLVEEISSLAEVVVVGYGTQKRSDITGSVASVPKERLQNLPVTNIFQAIEGSVAGLNVATTSAAPGTSVNIQVRGQNTFNVGNGASTGPFIVVDGIPITTLGGVTNDINPNDVASIEVLKDPSAVAIYGTRGANGVILITTKRGKTGKPKISYNAYAGPEYEVNLVPLMSEEQYVQKNLEYARQTGRTPDPVPNFSELANYNAGITTDWIKAASQQGIIQDHNLNISGGTADIKYYISGEYLNQKGVLKGYQYQRASLRSNLDANLTKWLTIGASLLYTSNNYDGGKVNFLQAARMSPYASITDANGNYIFFPMAPDTFYENPFLGLNTDSYNRTRNITGNFYGEIRPSFLPGLKYRINASTSYLPSRTDTYSGRSANNPLGSARANNSEQNSWIIENLLTYDRMWQKHHLDVTGLYSMQKTNTFSTGIAANTFINDQLSYNGIDAAAVQKGSSQLTEAQYLSQMLRINYSYNSKYLFTATARRDGYSAFGANTDKYGLFPSVAFGWNISQEDFLKNVTAIDNIKLRVSYGKSGNQAIAPYQTISQQGSIQYVYAGVTTSGVAASILGNPNLKWESTLGTNIGIDFSLLKERISGTIDAYSTKTSDILAARQIPVISGYSSILDNIGKTQNHGIEVTLNTVNIRNKNFSWRTSYNMAINRNKIISIYGDDKDDIGNRLFIGQSLGAVYDYKLIGVWQTGEDPSKSDPGAKPGDLKFADITGDGKITSDDRVYLGNSFPKFSGGLTNTFSYKQFSLNVFLQAVTGVLKNNPTLDFQTYAGRQNLFANIGYWTPENGNNSRPSLAYGNTRNYNYPSPDNLLRLKDITFSYRVNNEFANKLGLSSALVYVSGRNIGTFTDWLGYDPEYGSFTNTSFQNYPSVATYVLGVNVSLK